MNEITQALLEYGSMGIFAAFLVWQHLSMQKRLDSLVKRFQDQLDQIQSKNEDKETSIRDRYDSVISGLQDEKSSFRIDVKGRVDVGIRRIDELDKKVEEIKTLTDSLTILNRDSNIQIVKGLEILQKMQEEDRLKEMARKMKQGEDPNWERR
tara:strand:- start:1365 stop:1823 length:459 start_codon:yes stop_codon:yes gene_type:complete